MTMQHAGGRSRLILTRDERGFAVGASRRTGSGKAGWALLPLAGSWVQRVVGV